MVSISSFSKTGVPALTGGGYAYPPNSSMTGFMDSIHDTMQKAYRGDDGQDVISWANGLVKQAEARKQAEAEKKAQQPMQNPLNTDSNTKQAFTQLLQFMLMLFGSSAST